MISIIVPIYNVELYLEKCIESIINQTYKDIEVILINDGSTDKSGIICDKYAKIDDRIIVLHKEMYFSVIFYFPYPGSPYFRKREP